MPSDSPPIRGSDWGSVPAIVDRDALDDLFSLTYEELRRLASSVRRNDRQRQPQSDGAGERGVAEARRLAADSDRRRRCTSNGLRRGRCVRSWSKPPAGVTPTSAAERRRLHGDLRRSARSGGRRTSRDLLALDAALDSLAQINPRQAVMIESRYFGGLDVAETAALLGVSEATILRDWRVAKAWLAEQIVRTR